MRTLVLAVVLSLAAAVSADPPPAAPDRSPLDPARFHTSRDGAPLPLPEETDAFTFVIYGDRTGGPADGVKVLAEAVRETNLLGPDLVMTVGDLIEGYNQNAEWMAQMREFRGIMDRLDCPWFPVAGNHDIYWRGPDRPAREHERNYEIHFGPLWYAFAHKNCWFIVLYTDEADPATGIRDFNRPASQVMSPEQTAWLRAALERGRDAEHVFVFLHHPRWIGGKYGKDWERIHPMLVEAGNVRAVFAGHIHLMRSDGPRDGIEYIALATTGGHQNGYAPEAGYLHHYDVVTVRPSGITMAALPVGSAMDVRAITAQVSADCRVLARTSPRIVEPLALRRDGTADGRLRVRYDNPTDRPLELELAVESADPAWRFVPAHRHERVPPRGSLTVDLRAVRFAGPGADLAAPELLVKIDYLTDTARFAIPDKRVPLDVVPAYVVGGLLGATELDVDGRRGYLEVASSDVALPDGPFTLEGWLRARDFPARCGYVTKTENSEFGIFVSGGVASFSVHLDGRYVEATADGPRLALDRWHHVAGVFDGQEVRLYVDGRLRARTPGSGRRTMNALPLLIGADVDRNGRAMSHFDGRIDDVRLSVGVRYESEAFTPARTFVADRTTQLLFPMRRDMGPWTNDVARNVLAQRRHAMLVPSGDR